MSRSAKVAIGIGIVVFVGLGVLFSFLFQSLQSASDDTKAVADQVAAAAAKDWGKSSFEALASGDFIAATAQGRHVPERYVQMFGTIASVEPCTIDGLQITNGYGWSQYSCVAGLANGSATLVIRLDNSPGSWKLADFWVKV